MAHIFISYKHDDGDFVTVLRTKLKEAGFDTWTDEDISSGEKWSPAIDNAILVSFAVIVVMSPEARKSEYVTYEWSFALGAGKTVIPIMLKQTELHPKLNELQYEDFTNRKARPWGRLIQKLRKIEPDAQFDSDDSSKRSNMPSSVQLAVDALNSPDAKERKKALGSLAQNNHPAAIEALADAVAHDIRDVRWMAASILAQVTNYSDTRAVPALLEKFLWDGNYSAVLELTKIGDAAVVEGFLSALRHDDISVCHYAMRSLIEIGDTAVVEGFLKLLGDGDGDMRRAAASALGTIGDKDAVRGLTEVLNDEDGGVRGAAASALGMIGDKVAVQGLLEVLKDEDSDVRGVAANALGMIGDKIAVQGLLEALNDEEGYDVKRFSPEPTVHTLNYTVRNAAIEALGKIGDSAAISGLIGHIHDKNSNVRQDVIEALGSIGDVSALPLLVEALRDENDFVRWAAANALGKIGDSTAVPGLEMILLNDVEGFVAGAASRALRDIGTPEAIEAIERWRREKDKPPF